ncbi:DUF397 domain-containing protein [Nocardia sp. NPDC057227]|uniref:DUF397 domain-containing protein n=1 Tax=Nocardia sp. NPDC057227 TaxID=3346056 RepID=UPI00363FB5D1
MSEWFVSSYSSDRQTCVEVRFRTGRVEVRDSKSPSGSPVLSWPAHEWTAFTAAIRAGALR